MNMMFFKDVINIAITFDIPLITVCVIKYNLNFVQSFKILTKNIKSRPKKSRKC